MNRNFTTTAVVRSLARVPVTLAIGGVALVIALLPSAAELLQFDRSAIAGGEFWRLATCHVTHWNLEHFQWDWLIFLVLAAVCELRDRGRMLGCVVGAAVAVTTVVWVWFPELGTYRGLSGIDTALFTMLAIDVVRDAMRDQNRLLQIAASGLLLGFAAKTAYEAITGQTYFVDQEAAGFVPLVWDHVAAGAVGVICALWTNAKHDGFSLRPSAA